MKNEKKIANDLLFKKFIKKIVTADNLRPKIEEICSDLVISFTAEKNMELRNLLQFGTVLNPDVIEDEIFTSMLAYCISQVKPIATKNLVQSLNKNEKEIMKSIFLNFVHFKP